MIVLSPDRTHTVFVFLNPAKLGVTNGAEYSACYHFLAGIVRSPRSILFVNVPGTPELSRMQFELLHEKGIPVTVRSNRPASGPFVARPRHRSSGYGSPVQGTYDDRTDPNVAASILFKPGEFSNVPIIVSVAALAELLLVLKAYGLTYPLSTIMRSKEFDDLAEVQINSDILWFDRWQQGVIPTDDLPAHLSQSGLLLLHCYENLSQLPWFGYRFTSGGFVNMVTEDVLFGGRVIIGEQRNMVTEDAVKELFRLYLGYVKNNPVSVNLLHHWRDRHPIFPLRSLDDKALPTTLSAIPR